MTPEDQIKAIAKLDGWDITPPDALTAFMHPDEIDKRSNWYRDGVSRPPINYLTSRNAIVSVIEKQPPKVLHQMYKHLCDWFDGESPENWIKATPSQLCEALLRATGKWIE